MKRFLSPAFLALFLVLSLGLGLACSDPTATPAPTSSAAPTESGGGTTMDPTMAPTMASTMAPTMAPTASEPKVLRFATANFGSERLDPSAASIAASVGLVGPLWDWLTYIAPDGQLHPELATNWEQVGDDTAWEIKLRQGVKFHNGDDMTAEDLRFTMLEVWPRDEASSSRKAQFSTDILDVEIVDPHTVIIHTDGVWPTLPFDVSQQPGIEGIILPKDYIGQVGWDGFEQAPVGTGPYSFVEHNFGDSITFERFEDYWGPRPGFDRLELIAVPESSTRVAMLKRNEVDVAEIILDQAEDLAASGFKIASDPQPTVLRYHLWGSYYGEPGFDGEGFADPGPIGDIKVREALNLAINKEEMAEALFLGRAEPVAVYPITSLAIGFPENLEPYGYDPERAKELLREAGYPDGFTIKIYSLAVGAWPHLDVSQVVAGYWEAIGVKSNIEPTDIGAHRPQWLSFPQDPAIVGAATFFPTASRLNGLDDLRIWWSIQGKNNQQAGNIDDLATAAAEATTVEEIARLVKEAYQRIHDDFRGLPLVAVDGPLWGYGNSVADMSMVRNHRGYLPRSFAAAEPK